MLKGKETEMKLDELMKEFGEKFQIEGFAEDDEGVYRLNADGMDIAIAEPGDGEHLVLWAEVCHEPPLGRERLYRILLQAMFMGQQTNGACFSIHDETVFLHQVETLSELDFDRFKSLLEKFINSLSAWRESCADFNSVASELEVKIQKDESESQALAMGMYMKV